MSNDTVLRAKATVLARRAQKVSDALGVIESIEREDGIAYDVVREGLEGILEKVQHEIHLLYPQIEERHEISDARRNSHS